MSLKITKCKDKSKDLVQDMYLKIGSSKIKEDKLTKGYIYAVLLNIYKNNVKKNSTFIDNGETKKVYFISMEDIKER